MKDIFINSWTVDVKKYSYTRFRAWGRTIDSKQICVHVDDFYPFLIIEPAINAYKALNNLLKEPDRMPVKTEEIKRPKLYYAKYTDGKKTEYSMLKCWFRCTTDFYYIERQLAKRGFKTHEYNIKPLLQFFCQQKIDTVGWHQFSNQYPRVESRRETYALEEYDIDSAAISKSAPNPERPLIPQLCVLSFDIETYSSEPTQMPRSHVPDDKIYQISCIVKRGQEISSTLIHYLPLELPKNMKETRCINCDSETMLIINFVKFIHDTCPDIIIGYNILGFDLRYIIERSKLLRCFIEVQKIGLHKYKLEQDEELSWMSQAFGNVSFTFVPIEGVVIIDLLPLVKRDHKLSNYKLSTVAPHFLGGDTKDDMSPAQMFRFYREGNPRKLGLVGKYCIKDSQLCIDLYEKLQYYTALFEMSQICHVQMFDLYTRGQQLKVFSQIYYECFDKIVVDCPQTDIEGGFAGARVIEPVPGIYENVVSLDVNSEYPSTIIAENICYTTLAIDPSIPDEICNINEWDDHIGCEHDPKIIRRGELTKILAGNKGKPGYEAMRRERTELMKYKPSYVMCCHRKFRFVKTEPGIIPTIVKNLLAARLEAKKLMKQFDSDSLEYQVINARQLALKVCTNSIYGFFGVQKGFLPLMAAAMTLTYLSRANIMEIAEQVTTKYGGQLVYGDTDSNYVMFPEKKTTQELWDWSKYVAAEISKTLPPPLNIEFEDAIYTKFLLLTKKRYVYLSCDASGKPFSGLGKKGVLLVRRDNCKFTKNIYAALVQKIFDNETLDNCLSWLHQEIKKLVKNEIPLNQLTITKSVGDCNGGIAGEVENGKVRIGNYIARALPEDEKAQKLALQRKGVNSKEEFYAQSVPPQIQLAERMRARGERIELGSRIEYLVTNLNNWRGKIGSKIEDKKFFEANNWFMDIDYLYYINSLTTPLDQLFQVVFHKENVMTEIYNFYVDEYKKIQKQKSELAPKIIIQC